MIGLGGRSKSEPALGWPRVRTRWILSCSELDNASYRTERMCLWLNCGFLLKLLICVFMNKL